MVIHQPLEEVFSFLANLENWSLWQPDLRESEQTFQGSTNTGTAFRQTLQIRGKPVELLCEVTEYEPNEKLSFACDLEDISFELDLVFEPVDGSTRLTGKGERQMNGFYSLFEPVVSREADEQVKDNLHNLKDFLEARSHGA